MYLNFLLSTQCDPNCYSKVLDTEAFINDQKVIENHIVFFARKDIKIGEELTYVENVPSSVSLSLAWANSIVLF